MFSQASVSAQTYLMLLAEDTAMKQNLIFVGAAAILGLALAQNSNGFEVLRTPGANNQLVVTESSPRAANLKMRCVGSRVEVVLDSKLNIRRNQSPLVSWKFDDAAMRQQRWNFEPESGLLILPQNFTRQFLEGIADSSQTRMTFPEKNNLAWNATFITTGFREAYVELPCKSGMILGNTTTVTSTMMPSRILDATVAFIAPLEFAKAFGGRFEPEGNLLAWEYNGVKLLLERGSTTVQNAIQNTSLELPRPVQIVGGRTVVPARLVSAFNCKLEQTKPTDSLVKVTCGAGTTLLERDLPRY